MVIPLCKVVSDYAVGILRTSQGVGNQRLCRSQCFLNVQARLRASGVDEVHVSVRAELKLLHFSYAARCVQLLVSLWTMLRVTVTQTEIRMVSSSIKLWG